MNVFLTSCGSGPDVWTEKAERLRSFHSMSRDQRYTLVDDAADADVILISNLRDENWHDQVLNHPLVLRYPEKCFGVHDGDRPFVILRGLYASVSGLRQYFGRVKGGSYSLYQERCRNPFLEREEFRANRDRPYLASFVGNPSDPIRRVLFATKFRRPDVLIEAVEGFNVFENPDPETKVRRQRHFCEVLSRSKFSLCPRGRGPSSIRLFESMQLGVAPVIIGDAWLAPEGPAWEQFSIRVPEQHLADVERIIEEREREWETMGRLARTAFEEFFSDAAYFNYVIDRLLEIRRQQWFPERLVLPVIRARLAAGKAKETLLNAWNRWSGQGSSAISEKRV